MAQQPVCTFTNQLSGLNGAAPAAGNGADVAAHQHSHDGQAAHTHGGDGTWTPDEHGHTHEHLEHAGE